MGDLLSGPPRGVDPVLAGARTRLSSIRAHLSSVDHHLAALGQELANRPDVHEDIDRARMRLAQAHAALWTVSRLTTLQEGRDAG